MSVSWSNRALIEGHGVVDENIDAAGRRRNIGDQFLDLFVLADVGLKAPCLDAERLDFLTGRIEAFPGPPADRHVRAVPGQRQRHSPADAARAAGDESDLVFQQKIHGLLVTHRPAPETHKDRTPWPNSRHAVAAIRLVATRNGFSRLR